MGRSCVFIDGGYFQKVLEKDFDRPKIDFSLVGPVLTENLDILLRTYYYNCPPYQSANPTDRERLFVRNADRFYHRLRQLGSFELRLGRLAFRGFSQDSGERIFEQKRVDVQLAVDLLTLSFSRQITTAVIVAGDSDFIPVLEAAKLQGVRVVVCHGVRNPAHRELLEAADEPRVLDEQFVNKVRLPNPPEL
jgi:uncharacterized LabA/DUF88 family protein